MFLVLEERVGYVSYGVDEDTSIIGIANSKEEAIELIRKTPVKKAGEDIIPEHFTSIPDDMEVGVPTLVYEDNDERYDRRFIELTDKTCYPITVASSWYVE